MDTSSKGILCYLSIYYNSKDKVLEDKEPKTYINGIGKDLIQSSNNSSGQSLLDMEL